MDNHFFPSYTLGADAYEAIPAICGKYGKTAVIIGGNKSRAAAEPKIRKAVEGQITMTGSFLSRVQLRFCDCGIPHILSGSHLSCKLVSKSARVSHLY